MNRSPVVRPLASLLRFALFAAFVLGLSRIAGNDVHGYLFHYLENGHLVGLAALLVVNGAMLVAFYLAVAGGRWPVAWLFGGTFLLLTASGMVAATVTGAGLTNQTIDLAIGESKHAGDFLAHYLTPRVLVACALLLGAGAIALVFFFRARHRVSPWTLWPLVVACFAAAGWLEHRTDREFGSVDPFRGVTKIAYALRNGLEFRPRAAPAEGPASAPRARHVVVVLDESIAYDHLGIGGYPRDTSPFLASIRGSFHDFGRALSSFNCSAASNYVLTAALGEDDLPDPRGQATLGRPNLFAFAKAAGYRTLYATAQVPDDRLQNHMSAHDLAYIDRYSAHEARDPMNDFRLIDTLDAFIADADRTFSFLVKSGAHFPWSRHKYVDEVFGPVPPDGQALSHDARDAFVNAYDNTIRWTVDRFLETLLARLAGRGVVVIYTADHGQSMPGGEGTLATHCSFTGAIPPAQAFVPLLVFGLDERIEIGGTGYYSHFQIAPTVRYLLGYAVDREHTLLGRHAGRATGFHVGSPFGEMRRIAVEPPTRTAAEAVASGDQPRK